MQITAARSNLQVAPEGFNFELTLSGFNTNTLADTSVHDPSFHDKYVFWDYGEDYAYDAPAVLADPSARRSRYSRGPLGSHTYRASGAHLVTVYVYEPSSQRWGRGIYRIGGANEDTPLIKDPEDLFDGLNTIYVDVTGQYSGSPVIGSQGASSLVEALNRALTATAAVRIMLARGQTFEIDASFSYRTSNTNQRNITIVSAPEDPETPLPRAIVRPSAAYVPGQPLFFDQAARDVPVGFKRDIVFADVDFQSDWDTTTESGPSIACIASAGFSSAYLLLDHCRFAGWDTVLTAQGTPTRDSYVVNDTVLTGWRNMGILDGLFTWAGFTGCRMTQNPAALSGGPKNGNHNEHGPFRFSQSNKLTVHSCDIFSGTGWFPNGSMYVTQPCMRYNTSSSPGCRANVQSNTMEGGTDIISFGNSDAGSIGAPMNAVIDGNFLVGNFLTSKAISSSFSGMTVRNNLFVIPDVERDLSALGGGGNGLPFGFVALIEYGTNTPANFSGPVDVYNNTIVNQLSAANAAGATGALPDLIFTGSGGVFTGSSETDNLLYEPAQAETGVVAGSLIGQSIFDPRYRGYQDFDTVLTLQTQYETPDQAGQIWLPVSTGTGILGAAMADPPPLVDFFGRERPSENHALGAFELPPGL